MEELAWGHLTSMGLSKKSALILKLVFFATRLCYFQLFLKRLGFENLLLSRKLSSGHGLVYQSFPK